MKISIIINIFNCESYIHKCVDSVLAQKYENFEVLLIDNGSTDKSKIICDEYTMRDLRVKSIHLDEFSGTEGAFKQGISEADGEYITFLNREIYLDRYFLTRITKSITTYNADLVICDCIMNDGTRNIRMHSANIESGIYEKERIANVIIPGLFSDDSPYITKSIEQDYKAKICSLNLMKSAVNFFESNQCTDWSNTLTMYALSNCSKMLYMKNDFLYYCNYEAPDIKTFYENFINYFTICKKITESNKLSETFLNTFKSKFILYYINYLAHQVLSALLT